MRKFLRLFCMLLFGICCFAGCSSASATALTLFVQSEVTIEVGQTSYIDFYINNSDCSIIVKSSDKDVFSTVYSQENLICVTGKSAGSGSLTIYAKGSEQVTSEVIFVTVVESSSNEEDNQSSTETDPENEENSDETGEEELNDEENSDPETDIDSSGENNSQITEKNTFENLISNAISTDLSEKVDFEIENNVAYISLQTNGAAVTCLKSGESIKIYVKIDGEVEEIEAFGYGMYFIPTTPAQYQMLLLLTTKDGTFYQLLTAIVC